MKNLDKIVKKLLKIYQGDNTEVKIKSQVSSANHL